MKELYVARVSRRRTLQWLGAALLGGPLNRYAWAGPRKPAAHATPKGYGTDPDLNHPTVPWSRTLTAHQRQLTAALSDLILPASDTAPAPSALGIPEFVDEWVSAPYPEQQADRAIILDGLQWIDAEAQQRVQRGFLDLDASDRQRIFETTVPRGQASAEATQEIFFQRLRYLVVGAYYTTPEGFQDIGYIGNVALPRYPPVTEEERSILDAELHKLGIRT